MEWERQRTYDFEAGREAGLSQGILQGAHDTEVRNAQNFLKEGDSPEKVARCVGLPLEEVIELQKQLVD